MRPLALCLLAFAPLALDCVPAACAGEDSCALVVQVSQPSGETLADARVSLWEARDADEAHARALSDEAGLAHLECRGGESAWLSVAHPDYPRVVRNLPAEHGGPVEVSVPPGRQRTLRVSDAGGRRLLPFVRAVVLPASGLVEERAFVAEALFARDLVQEARHPARLRGLGEEASVLAVMARGHALHFEPLVPGASMPLEIRLSEEDCVDLHLVEGSGSTPVAGARIASSAHLISGSLEHLQLWTTSDAGGRARYCAPGGSTELFIAHEHFAPQRLALARVRDTPRVTLQRPARVEGQVVDAGGAPVARAQLVVRGASFSRETSSDSVGRFVLGGLPRAHLEIEARRAHPGGTLERARRYVDFSSEREAQLTLGLGLSARLVVEDDGGQPLAGARIIALRSAAALEEARCNDKGETRLASLGEGALEILALREEGALYFEAPRRPQEAGEPYRLAVPAASVFGRVLDHEGKPLEGALVSCAPRRASLRRSEKQGPLWLAERGESVLARGGASLAASNDEGRFRLRRPPWCRALDVQGPRPLDGAWPLARKSVELRGPGRPLEIRLESGRGVVVRVRADEPMNEGEGRVELRRPGALGASAEFGVLRGEARVPLEGEGPWQVVARVPGFAPAPRPLPAARSREQERVDVHVERGGFLVVEAQGAWPADDALPIVDRRGEDWSRLADAWPMGEKRLMVGPLPRGVYEVRYERGPRRARVRQAGEIVEALPGD